MTITDVKSTGENANAHFEEYLFLPFVSILVHNLIHPITTALLMRHLNKQLNVVLMILQLVL